MNRITFIKSLKSTLSPLIKSEFGRISPQYIRNERPTLSGTPRRIQSSSSFSSTHKNTPLSPSAKQPSSTPAHLTSNFCKICGDTMNLTIPSGDNKERSVCSSCGFTDYMNPRMVVGAIVEHNGSVLLCRRGIQPQKGLWTTPAGFLELGETTAEGARRETREETDAAIHIDAPFVHFDIPAIGQSYILFRSTLAAPFSFKTENLPESLEVKLFPFDSIPYSEIAFSSVATALRFYVDDAIKGEGFKFRYATILKEKDAGPNSQFKIVDVYAIP